MRSTIHISTLPHSTPPVPIFVLQPMGSREIFFSKMKHARARDQPPLCSTCDVTKPTWIKRAVRHHGVALWARLWVPGVRPGAAAGSTRKQSSFHAIEGSATCNPDSRFNRFCQIFIKIQDSSQDLKYFKSLKYCEILSLLAINAEMLLRFKIPPV